MQFAPLNQLKANNKKNVSVTKFFLDATTYLCKRSCPSVGPSVRPSVPMFFRTKINAVSASGKSVSDRIGDDEVVASDLPMRNLFSFIRKKK